jgi:hypothetical protein
MIVSFIYSRQQITLSSDESDNYLDINHGQIALNYY